MNIEQYVLDKAILAKNASRLMGNLDTSKKNIALLSMSEALIKNINIILEANSKDIVNAKKANMSKALLDRLVLNEKRIENMSEQLHAVALLPDPIGISNKMWNSSDNLKICQVQVPIGVIGMIYEARPNVTVDASALCLKSGNSVILRGGSEAINSNKAIVKILTQTAIKAGLPEGCIQFIDITDRKAVDVMMKLNGYIDVLIPRGGAGLINSVIQNATVPVIETGVGNCHVYVDKDADLNMAQNIIINAKTQRPAVCNAMETLLIHKDIAHKFLPELSQILEKFNVELRGCDVTQNIIKNIIHAKETDWSTEYLDLILAIKVVDSLDGALEHIYKYGTKHSEAIITNNYANSQRFLKEVDAAAVYVNASTRFTDGSQFGFGAEIGISTQKLHARGPMGLNELTTTKYVIYGEGQVRE